MRSAWRRSSCRAPTCRRWRAARGPRPHDRALVVGHSNTVPELLRALKVATPITIADAEYDNLFIVVPQKDAPPLLLRLKY